VNAAEGAETDRLSTVGLDVLEEFAVEVLEGAGLPPPAARLVAESLCFAEARGISSHGVIRLPIYEERLRKGLVDARANPVVESGDGPLHWVDARNAVGALGASTGLRAAQQGAARHGVGIAGVRHSNHCGALGFYVERAASRGLIALAGSNAPVTMAYFGGRTRAVGTNPIAIGIPRPGAPPIVLDIATSATARGKIIEAAGEGRAIPPGWAVDAEGRSTTDARAALEGSVLPFAGPKGSGLAMMLDLLCGALAGAATGRRIGDMYEDWDRPQNVGHQFVAIDPEVAPGGAFLEEVEAFVTDVHALPAGEHFERVLLPGEIEARAAEIAQRDGVTLKVSTLRSLQELGTQYDARTVLPTH
jgi:ureidoglycolate dehydrogenase (NAD+)